MKRVPRLFRPSRDNSDVSSPFPKGALAINEVVFGACGLPRQAQRDNRMLPQHSSKSESAKRLYTAKRMIYLLFYCANSLTFDTIISMTTFRYQIVACF